MDGVDFGSWEWTIATGEVRWSDELYRIYGLEPGRAITFEYFLSLVHPDEKDRIGREIQKVLQHPGPFGYREMVVRPDGGVRTLDTTGEAVLDEHGAVLKLLGRCRDVTEMVDRDERLRFYSDVFARVGVGLSAWQLDHEESPPRLRLVAYNPRTEELLGVPLAARLGQRLVDLLPVLEHSELHAHARQMTAQSSIRKFAPFARSINARAPWLSATLFPLPARHVGLVLEDCTALVRTETLLAGERRALEMLTTSAPLENILSEIARSIERASPATIASVLLLDDTGTKVKHGAAPGLPDAYNRAVDGQLIGPAAGSCGTAMFRKQRVIVEDIETDPLWANYRELARAHDLRACWSEPILGSNKHVLGTFALYHREPISPTENGKELLERAAHVVGIVIERRALDDQLRALAARVEAAREDERTQIARDIHDQLGQALTALKLDIGWLQRRLGDGAILEKLVDMSRTTDEVLAAVRRISADLRPGILDDLGLRAAIEWQAEEFQKHSGVAIAVGGSVTDLQLERGLATNVFRIFQEALTNVARHANAEEVQVTLELQQGRLHLEIADDGVGVPEVGPRASTLGILGMRERARRLGGECSVKRREPRGTVVSVTVPLRFPAERGADLSR